MYLLQTNAQSPNVLIYSRVRHIQISFRHAKIEKSFVPNAIIVMCKTIVKIRNAVEETCGIHKFRSGFFLHINFG